VVLGWESNSPSTGTQDGASSTEVGTRRFYDELEALESSLGDKRLLADCESSTGWPNRGVYFFFEKGEVREDGSPRVVRVGTHALKASKSTLWGRLRQHRGNTGGSYPGGGNHRGSIFRKHVGSALLTLGDWPADVHKSWGVGNTADSETRAKEQCLEHAVTKYIGAMPFLWLGVDDEPGPMSSRAILESGALGLLSNASRTVVDGASTSWLGRHANSSSVRESGLWNVAGVHAEPRHDWLNALHEYVSLAHSL
jgi:hypothetical protein